MPLTLVPPEPMDNDTLLEFCAANDLYRIERMNTGELRIMTPAGSGSGFRNAAITGQLFAWAQRDGRGVTFDSSAGFSLADGSMLNPDASSIELSRWQSLTPQEQERFAPICPTFVVELRSASDSRKELERKMELWIANGAALAWLVDPVNPKERSVSIYRAGNETEVMVEPSTVAGTGPIEGFELVMSWVWA